MICTSEKRGGAAVATNRLMEALNNNGVKAKMLVRDKDTDNITVVALNKSLKLRFNFLWERWTIFVHNHFSRKHLFEVDIANAGTDITSLREFKEADIIHLSWINQGMLSLNDLKKIFSSGKPVVWTMHDIWPATAICHYAHSCTAFMKGCNNCQYLYGGGGTHDLSAKIWKRKKTIYGEAAIEFVTCSKWLENEAKKSALLIGKNITSIPNPINTNTFKPQDKRESRVRAGLPLDKKLILFVSQRVTDQRKGIKYFIEACQILAQKYPEMMKDTGIAIMGGHSEDVAEQLALPVYPLGYLSNEKKIINVYNAVDIFVLPSLEDNLPNTIMESMACGVPCIGFNVGGIPEMINHEENGYVAEAENAEDLAKGIHWTLVESDYRQLSANAAHKVTTEYSLHNVAMRYLEIYNDAANNKKTII